MSKPDNFIGQKLTNNRGQSFFIKEKVITAKGKSNRYRVIFDDTGYETVAEKIQIKRGTVKDRFTRSVFGVGYLGNVKMSNNKVAYRVWSGMLERCYHTSCSRYPYYGGSGVRVCDRWHCFEYFLSDLEKIDGYEEDIFAARKIFLDKDIKQKDVPKNEMVYSLETCTFVSRELNSSNRDLTDASLHFNAISPSGEVFNVTGLRPFAEKYGLHQPIIKKCLRKEREEYDGWKFELIKESNWRRNKSA
ncbi:hypothetical protein P9738_12990 [Bacillus siamensis]|uniref:hypothetical protein n=1 Tax=Bacillus siamensis TaxID=659243 RepID=UPI002E1E83F4|nr:hypothetical protein [Bacillus siamensis]MED5097117.1 hypothetical protein [Bacillus siamensis]